MNILCSRMQFPSHGDPQFQQKINSLAEYNMYKIPPVEPVTNEETYETLTQNACQGFEKTLYQHLMQHYLSTRSPYRGLLLFHGLGVGKTCSSITIAEALLDDHNARMEPRVWVVLPNALQKSYEEQIVNTARLVDIDQCMGDKYRHMVFGSKDADVIKRKIGHVVKSRYQMFTYEGFAKEAEKRKFKVSDKVIIVDEAHNLRIQDTDKRAAQALLQIAKEGENNRIVLLSATPMYNEPDEIFWLLSILSANDKRKDVLRKLPALYSKLHGTRNEAAFAVLKQLSQEYISYIKGTNPFTFAARLSPKDSGIPMLTSSDRWESAVKDGLVETPCSNYQIECMRSLPNNDATMHQALNITYPSCKIGKEGFFTVFRRESDNEPVHVSYANSYKNHLVPSEEKLGSIAPKIQRICDLVRNSEGIVVIYSQYVWSGVIPIAVALEHMGFRRHGTRNILKNADIMDPPVTYPGIPIPSYCILSGESAAMGNTKIEDMIRHINDSNNKYGERIKVVIMSPVAGEGLSLRNIREVHIVDPWYHLNRLDQVIGRAFRTCHHNTLPIQERNVSVFIHVATRQGEDTNDIKTYKIAARKAVQTDEVEALIRDSAIDCPLMKNVNYFPKSLFSFDVMLRSSRGVIVPYHYGDDIQKAPRCVDPPVIEDDPSIRKDVYKNLIPTGLQRLRKYLQRNKDTIYFTFQELENAIKMHPIIVKSVLNEATKTSDFLRDPNMKFMSHNGKFVVKKIPPAPTALHLKFIKEAAPQTVEEEGCDRERVIAAQPVVDPNVGKVLIYKALDSVCWSTFARKIIGYNENIPLDIARHVELLFEEGAFVATRELPRHRNPSRAPYIGYVDIFDTDKFAVVLYDYERGQFRDATDAETDIIKRSRREQTRPSAEQVFATIEPHKYTKQRDLPMNNEVKLWLPGPTGRARKGVVCESLRKNDTLRFLQELNANVVVTSVTKEQVCFSLAVELLQKGRLLFLPNFKPT